MRGQVGIPTVDSLEHLESLQILERLKQRCDACCDALRPLRDEEILRLEALGNQAGDWRDLRVSQRFIPDHVRNSRFFGTCRLGWYDGTPVDTGASISLPSGIYDSIVVNATVGDMCCLWNAKGLNNYFLDEGVVLYNVGSLCCSPTAVFGCGREIAIGIETGGRGVLSFGDLTVAIAQEVAMRRETAQAYELFIAAYLERVRVGYGIVGSGSQICNCPQIMDAFIGEGAQCGHAILVKNATILSSAEEPTRIDDGAYVRNSCIQWGCHVSSMAIVDDSVITEHAHVERHGKVSHSIIGPNTGIAEGEVTASLVGPFVGFHHQALLIGALWPEGKGNVAYGANVGSNHTSKAPDQEIICGEGLFFGLGVNIKFPADYSRAPYSIIATGVTTLPQRVDFPFALINTPSRHFAGVSPAYNELYPGWVLSDDLYAVRRNEAKYIKRNKARRLVVTSEVFRPEIVDRMVEARGILSAVATDKEYYTGTEIAGVGKNIITRKSIITGIDTYSRYIELYCLTGLFRFCRRLRGEGQSLDGGTLLSDPADDPRWEHERSLLFAEGFDCRSLHENLERLAELIALTTQAVASAKEKDDIRGRAIMGDYDAAHTAAAQDEFVKETIAKNKALLEEIQELQNSMRA